jgi:hypothetical protein
MDDVVIARAQHVLAVIIWIGGVALATTVVLPAVRCGDVGPSRLQVFEAIERRFWIRVDAAGDPSATLAAARKSLGLIEECAPKWVVRPIRTVLIQLKAIPAIGDHSRPTIEGAMAIEIERRFLVRDPVQRSPPRA